MCMKTIAVLLCTALCSSCCTKALWQATDPNEYVEVSFKNMTEAELKAKGLHYYRDETQNLFYVEQNSKQKVGNYTRRTLGIPVAVATDALIGLIYLFVLGAGAGAAPGG
jgi:hypothetical protein